MHFIDKQDDFALAALHLVHHRLQSLLELTSVLRTGDQRTQIQRDQSHTQRLRNIALHDTIRKTLHNGCFTDSRFTDQHRVVLRTTTENPNHTTNLLISTNHRIDLSLLCLLHQINSVLIQCVIGTFRSICVSLRITSLLFDGVAQFLLCQSHTLKQRFHSRITEQGQQDMILRNTRIFLSNSILLSNT